MVIRKQLDFDRSTDKFVGYVNMGVPVDDLGDLPIAKEALVFLLVSLTEQWKIPVAYFLIDAFMARKGPIWFSSVLKSCMLFGVLHLVSVPCIFCCILCV